MHNYAIGENLSVCVAMQRCVDDNSEVTQHASRKTADQPWRGKMHFLVDDS